MRPKAGDKMGNRSDAEFEKSLEEAMKLDAANIGEERRRIVFERLIDESRDWYAAVGNFIVVWSIAEVSIDSLVFAYLGISRAHLGRLVTVPMDASRKIRLVLDHLISMNTLDLTNDEMDRIRLVVNNLDHARVDRQNIAHGLFGIDSGEGRRWNRSFKLLRLSYSTQKLKDLAWWTDRHSLFIYNFLNSRNLLAKSEAQILEEYVDAVSESES